MFDDAVEAILIKNGLHCGELVSVFFKQFGFGLSFSFLVKVPQLQVVNDTNVVSVLEVGRAELVTAYSGCIQLMSRAFPLKQI